MAGNHMDVLAAQIYNEKNIVSYRLLSRLLGVHVNLAKQMLAEFYQQAKADKKPCHATFILSGLVEASIPPPPNDEMQVDTTDDFPMSSPVMATQESSRSSQPKTKLVRTVILADEKEVYGLVCSLEDELIEEVKNKFSELTSIHVYSLSPVPMNDPILLTTCSYDIARNHDAKLLPPEAAQKYGIITNPNAIKREVKKHTAPPVTVTTAAAKPKFGTKPSPKTETPAVSEAQESKTEAKLTTEAQAHAAKVAAKSTAKRTASGNIMTAFANAPPKTAKPKPKEEEKPAVPDSAPRISAKRQQELDEVNKMMEEDEPELEDFPEAPVAEDSQDTDSQAMAEVCTTQEEPTPPTEERPKRKRGKRKVLKKTTKRDEKGYLVTKNDWVYESFSEDEDSDVQVEKKPAPSAPKAAPAPASKGKKDGAGQKSLMSFFGKK